MSSRVGQVNRSLRSAGRIVTSQIVSSASHSANARMARMTSRKLTSCLSFGSAPMLSSMKPGGRGRSWSVMTSAFAFGIRGDSPELVLYFTYW